MTAEVIGTADEAPSNPEEYFNGEILEHELFWCDHQPWLEEQGYMLRPRYRPGWTPHWTDEDFYWDFEEGTIVKRSQVLDATRISDGETVALKRISRKIHPYEVDISRMFSMEPLASDPRNHCVPIYEVLQVPDDSDIVLLVMPLLRSYNNPRFDTVGEAVEYFRQIIEGLQFMHDQHVAHRDCMNLNIMMDPKPLFPKMFHPQAPRRTIDFKGRLKHYTRTDRPTKYYLIDFGLSRKYNPADGPPLEYPIWGGDKTVPEFHRSDDACDPFPTDIYYLGNMIREDFLQAFHGVKFMQPLVDDMVHDDPAERPNIAQVAARFSEIRGTLGYWTLRSRLVKRDEMWIMRFIRNIRHVYRTIRYIVTGRAAIPTP